MLLYIYILLLVSIYYNHILITIINLLANFFSKSLFTIILENNYYFQRYQDTLLMFLKQDYIHYNYYISVQNSHISKDLMDLLPNRFCILQLKIISLLNKYLMFFPTYHQFLRFWVILVDHNYYSINAHTHHLL